VRKDPAKNEETSGTIKTHGSKIESTWPMSYTPMLSKSIANLAAEGPPQNIAEILLDVGTDHLQTKSLDGAVK